MLGRMPKPDLHQLLDQHMEAMRHAMNWTEKGNEELQSGNIRRAKRALKMADRWREKFEAIERKTQRRTPM